MAKIVLMDPAKVAATVGVVVRMTLIASLARVA
jgi:hypothetical protein